MSTNAHLLSKLRRRRNNHNTYHSDNTPNPIARGRRMRPTRHVRGEKKMTEERVELFPFYEDLKAQWNIILKNPHWDDLNRKEKDSVIQTAREAVEYLIYETFCAIPAGTAQVAELTMKDPIKWLYETIEKTQKSANVRIKVERDQMLLISEEMIKDIWHKHSPIPWDNITGKQKIEAETTIRHEIWKFMYEPEEVNDLSKIVTDIITRSELNKDIN